MPVEAALRYGMIRQAAVVKLNVADREMITSGTEPDHLHETVRLMIGFLNPFDDAFGVG